MSFRFGFFDEPPGLPQEAEASEGEGQGERVGAHLEGEHQRLAAARVAVTDADARESLRGANKRCEVVHQVAVTRQGLTLAAVQAGNVRLEERGDSESSTVAERTDVEAGLYEGGFKLWECAIDLVKLMADQHLLEGSGAPRKVLELGCGHGLPGVFAAMQGAGQVCFQDLNREVLVRTTMRNVQVNLGADADEALRQGRISFVSGDWRGFGEAWAARREFDLILTSETVYSPDSFQALFDVIVDQLAPDGVVLLAAKRFYFGVGGGTTDFGLFLDAPERRGQLHSELVASFQDGASNVRDIVRITRPRAAGANDIEKSGDRCSCSS